MRMKIKVTEIAHHRNGVMGAGFHVVMFRQDGLEMCAIVFDEPNHVAVFDFTKVVNGVIEFGVNSHRGDHYEGELRYQIKQWEDSGRKALKRK